MTLPDERFRAVMMTMRFLTDLCNPNVTPRVPKVVRQQARSLLRHYPSHSDMKQASENNPHIFQERMEPLYRMVKAYEIEKEEKK